MVRWLALKHRADNGDLGFAGFDLGWIRVSWVRKIDRSAKFILQSYCDLVPLKINNLLPARLRSRVKSGLQGLGKGQPDPAQEDEFLLTHKHGEQKIALSVQARLAGLSEYKRQIAAYQQARAYPGPAAPGALRIAVYVAITRNYDSIKLPEELDPRIDYVLFSDAPVPDCGVYQVRPIPYFNDDPVRRARFVKTHPHLLLQDYDIAIWVDSNIMLLGDFWPLIQSFIAAKKVVAGNYHPCRTSVYEEGKTCIKFGNDSPAIIRKQMKNYRRCKFEHHDLVETNVMMFDLREERAHRLLDLWWAELERHSKRDQLSFNYCAARLGLDWHRLTGGSIPVLNHPNFALMVHDHGQGPAQKLVDALAAGMISPGAGPSFASQREARIATQKKRRIEVIVCVHNALPDVRLCLASVLAHRQGAKQGLILIDDGSDGDTADYLRRFAAGHQGVCLQRNESARGFTLAANQGLRAARGELAIILNSDTLVTDGWAEKMADAVFTTPGAGIVGVMSNAAGFQSLPDNAGSRDQTAVNPLPPGLDAEDLNRCCEQWSTLDLVPLVPLVHGFCIGITRETLQRVGLFDEEGFPGGYGVEDDYCLRAGEAGVLGVVAGHTYIYHAKSKSYADAQRVELMRRGMQTLMGKHGKARLERAMASMQNNPYLKQMRRQAAELYAQAPRAADRQG